MKKILALSLFINFSLLLLLGYSERHAIKEKIFPLKKEEYNAHYLERKSLFEELITTKGNIIFLGDSITEGGEWAELLGNPQIVNRGIGGDTAKGIINRLDSIVSASPKKVFIMIGVNDLSRGVSVKTLLKNYETIIQRLKDDTTAEIYVQSVFPATNQSFKRTGQIPLVNQKLKRLSDQMKVIFVDLYPLFSVDGTMNKSYSFDGVHLNGEGYRLWAKEVKEYVK